VTDALRACPYVGLTAYSEEDAEFFFGREGEIDLVIANLKGSRLTLLYGESGVGKSSILRAGVIRRLQAEIARNRSRRYDEVEEESEPHKLPLAAALFRGPWLAPPLPSLMEVIYAAVKEAVGDDVPPWQPRDNVVETLRTWTKLVRTILVVLDQFEEYFLYHAAEAAPDTVAGALAAIVNEPNLRVNFLLSTREDALAKLDPLKKHIPIYGNVLRIKYLDERAAKAAIEKPLERYTELAENGGGAYWAEPELIEEILRNVKTGRMQGAAPAARVGKDGGAGGNGKGIDTPVLQLVLTRMWEEETRLWDEEALEARPLRLETFRDRLHGVESIVRTQLDPTMATLTDGEKDIAARAFRYLVTPSGSKFAQSARDLSGFTDIAREEIEVVLEKLAKDPSEREQAGRGIILRPVPPPPGQEDARYEIFHDALGPTVLAWSTRHLEQRAREEGERLAEERARARSRVRRRIGLVVLVVLAALAGLAALSIIKWRQADTSLSDAVAARQEAASRGSAARAAALLSVDPHRAIEASLGGLDPGATDEAVRALRVAMSQSRLRFVYRGDADVTHAAYSSSGHWLVTGASDGTAQLLNTNSGERHDLPGHEGALWAVGFNPDGSRAVTAGDDGTARVWDVATGDLLATFTKHRDTVVSASFSPSEPLVLTASYDGTVRIWDAQTAEQRAILRGAPTNEVLTSASFSPNGNWAVTAASGATAASPATVRLWRRPSNGWQHARKPTYVLAGHTGFVFSASFSDDGRLLVTAGEDRTARIWNVASGRLRQVLEGHQRYVANAVFSPDAKVVATVSEKTLRFWDVKEGFLFYKARVSADWVSTVAFRPTDGELIVTAGSEGVARVWEADTGALLMELRGHTDPIVTAAFTKDGDSIVTAGSDGTARIWDVRTGLELRVHSDWVHSARFAPDGDSVFTVSADHFLIKWDSHTGDPDWFAEDWGGESLNDVIVDSSGRYVVSVGDDTTGVVWDAETGDDIVVLQTGAGETPRGHTAEVAAVDFDPREGPPRIATGGADERALIWTWSGNEARVIRELDGNLGADEVTAHRGGVDAVAYSPDGSRLVTAGIDKTARVWNPDTGELLASFSKHGGIVGDAVFHPNGRLVATASEDWTVRVWRASDGRQVKQLGGDGGPLRTVAFSRDGHLLAAGGAAGFTYVWEWPSGKLLAAMKMHSDLINSVAFGEDGRILTASDDYTAKLYRCTTCGPLDELEKRARARVDRIRY
jgi:WD40 repeat protein